MKRPKRKNLGTVRKRYSWVYKRQIGLQPVALDTEKRGPIRNLRMLDCKSRPPPVSRLNPSPQSRSHEEEQMPKMDLFVLGCGASPAWPQ